MYCRNHRWPYNELEGGIIIEKDLTMEYQRYDTSQETLLEFQGELDALTAPKIRDLIDNLAMEKRKQVQVDISKLSFLDSSGVAAIVSLYKRLQSEGGALALTGATGQPLAV